MAVNYTVRAEVVDLRRDLPNVTWVRTEAPGSSDQEVLRRAPVECS